LNKQEIETIRALASELEEIKKQLQVTESKLLEIVRVAEYLDRQKNPELYI